MLVKTLKIFPKFLLLTLVVAILAGAVQFSCTGDPPSPRFNDSQVNKQDGSFQFNDGANVQHDSANVQHDSANVQDQFVDVVSSGTN